MAYQIEFFRRSPTAPHGEPMGARLEGFSSRRAARSFAERHHPTEADGFWLLQDGNPLIIVHLQRPEMEDRGV